MNKPFSFPRKQLAEAYCDSLSGQGINNATSGLFFAAPRRVGKTTFLIEDLIPTAKRRNWTPIYIDLWSNTSIDPALLIIEAIKDSISRHSSKLSKLKQQMKLQQVKILGSLELDFNKPGIPENITITQLLEHHLKLTKQPCLLIIDEAQHVLTSNSGFSAMFAIKSARDQINRSSAAPHLMIVCTGSNRDKLAQLVIKKDQPFFGSEITNFPLLGRNYTDKFTDYINKGLSENNQFIHESVWQAFQLVGHRPEILRHLVGSAAINNEANELVDLLTHSAYIWHSEIWQEYHNDYEALPKLQRCVLALLIKEKHQWSPFSAESMQYYQGIMDSPELGIPTVQTAIQALRDKGFIWQSSRGRYALEDDAFADWYKHIHTDE